MMLRASDRKTLFDTSLTPSCKHENTFVVLPETETEQQHIYFFAAMIASTHKARADDFFFREMDTGRFLLRQKQERQKSANSSLQFLRPVYRVHITPDNIFYFQKQALRWSNGSA